MTNPPLDPADVTGPVEDIEDQDAEPSTMAPSSESPTDQEYVPGETTLEPPG